MKRRQFIKSSAVVTCPFLYGRYQDIFKSTQSEVHYFNVGAFKCTLVRDFIFKYTVEQFYKDVPKDQLESELGAEQLNLPIPSPFVSLLIEKDKDAVLVDTGLGVQSEPLMLGDHPLKLNGSSLKNLEAAGKKAEDITHVVFSHAHPDHAAGNYSDGELVYKNARFVMHQLEWDYWINKYGKDGNSISPMFEYTIDKQIKPLGNLDLLLTKGESHELVSGMHLLLAPGHTPGQYCIHLDSNGERFLYISDIWFQPLNVKYPEWKNGFDLDDELSIKTRKKYMDLAYGDQMLVQSFHFPFPGIGRVDKVGDQMAWVSKV